MRVTIDLSAAEYDEIRQLAARERRDLRDQVVVLALQALRVPEKPSESISLASAAPRDKRKGAR
ncbi:MAG TPA: hypothetical protein VKN18_21010 [Blastocatellia bacterium]|nr:hypothetical protein [Blastocatellia bacterium]